MEEQRSSVCLDLSLGSLWSDQTSNSVESSLSEIKSYPFRRFRRRHPPHRTNLDPSLQSSPKSPKLSHNEKSTNPPGDFISALPDSLIQEILSLLPTEDAVKTSVLSRRWSPVWTQIPNLCFIQKQSRHASDLVSFLRLVMETLQHFNGKKVKQFMISVKYTKSMSIGVDYWARFATNRHVENLSLIFDGKVAYSLPQYLCNNSCIKELTLRLCTVSLETSVSWPSLKVLSLSDSKLDNGTVQRILLGCPKLQDLKLHGRVSVGFIRSKTLQFLTLDGIYNFGERSGDSVTEICCPNLLSLSLLGFIYRRTFRLVDVSSLQKADLDFKMTVDEYDTYDCKKQGEIIKELLTKLCDVEKLIIGPWCLQVLSVMQVQGIDSQLSKRNYLEVKTEMCEWELAGIENLLPRSPHLKKLVINLLPSNSSELEFEFRREFAYYFDTDNEPELPPVNWIFESFQKCLENIEINGFDPNTSAANGYFVKFMGFLVKKTTLKEVNIYEKSGALYGSWKFSEPYKRMGNDPRNLFMLQLSDSLPEDALLLHGK